MSPAPAITRARQKLHRLKFAPQSPYSRSPRIRSAESRLMALIRIERTRAVIAKTGFRNMDAVQFRGQHFSHLQGPSSLVPNAELCIEHEIRLSTARRKETYLLGNDDQTHKIFQWSRDHRARTSYRHVEAELAASGSVANISSGLSVSLDQPRALDCWIYAGSRCSE